MYTTQQAKSKICSFRQSVSSSSSSLLWWLCNFIIVTIFGKKKWKNRNRSSSLQFDRIILLLHHSKLTLLPFQVKKFLLLISYLIISVKNGQFPGSFYCIFVVSIHFYINICRWLDLNHQPLLSETTTLPTEPQSLPVRLSKWSKLQRNNLECFS